MSSGAIATGMPYLLLDERPSDLATQQAAAAVGQNVLIYRYQEALRPLRHRRRPGAADRRRPREPDAPLATRGARWSGCSGCASSRSSTRTTPSPRTRSASATTTGSRRWSAQLIGADALVLLSDIECALHAAAGRAGRAPDPRRGVRRRPARLRVRLGRRQQRRHRGSGHEGVRGTAGRGIRNRRARHERRPRRSRRCGRRDRHVVPTRTPSPSRRRSRDRSAGVRTRRRYTGRMTTTATTARERMLLAKDAAARSIGLLDGRRQARRHCSRSPTRSKRPPAEIVAANAEDLERGRAGGLSVALQDRLRLDEPRVAALADRGARDRRAARPGRPRPRRADAPERRAADEGHACPSAWSARSTRRAPT